MPEKANQKSIISIICAIARDRAIGKNNRLLWNIPEDLLHFKKITAGHPVIMGEKTYYSIGRSLPQRVNIVLTRKPDLTLPGCVICHSMEEAIEKAEEVEKEPARYPAMRDSVAGGEIFIIGGGQVYQQAISFADKLYLTIVEGEYEADTYFPEYSEFKNVISEEKCDNGEYKFTYLELVRDNMKKIYVAHSTHFDYENELYAPLAEIKNLQFIFPHQQGSKPEYSKDIIKNCALLLAEVSVPSLGTGIEVGWASAYGIPVVFMYKEGVKISSSLKLVSNNFFQYNDLAQEKSKIVEIAKTILNHV